MKALCVMLDDNFMIGFRVFWKSFIHFNGWFNLKLIVIDVGLSGKKRKEIISIYSNTEFRKPKYENYKNVNTEVTTSRLVATYYTLDVFSYSEFDKIVFMDVDTLVLASLEYLFDNDFDIAACNAYSFRKDILIEQINSGVFVIGKKYLNEKTYKDLLKIIEVGHKMPDQTALNIYFRGKFEYLPKEYNVEKRMIKSKKYKNFNSAKNIKILHFVSLKPWQDHTLAPECETICMPFIKLWKYWKRK